MGDDRLLWLDSVLLTFTIIGRTKKAVQSCSGEGQLRDFFGQLWQIFTIKCLSLFLSQTVSPKDTYL